MTTEPMTTAALAHELRETVGRVIRRLRAEPGPPFSQLTVLGRIDREGPASISDLAGAERMRPQSMAQIVHDLQDAGLVTRRPDPADKRRSFDELTSAGVAALETSRARREDWLTRALDRQLDARERELLSEALVLLGRLTEA
jgi:DNA-binding MarR family transcriptional regulator